MKQTGKVLIIMLAMFLSFGFGYTISAFRLYDKINAYDLYTLSCVYSQIDSISEVREKKTDTVVLLKEYESVMHRLARYAQLSPQIRGLTGSLIKIADLCDDGDGITPEETKYLTNINTKLKEYIREMNIELNEKSTIARMFGFHKKFNTAELKDIFQMDGK